MFNIYNQEKSDGLQDVLSEPLVLAFKVPFIAKKQEVSYGKVKSIKNLGLDLFEDTFIYQYPSILVTAGVWNLNDHVFDKYEVWYARKSSIGKPTNLSHNPQQVVGHILDCLAITDQEETSLIPDELNGKPNTDIPDIYHLLNVDNFYKYNIDTFQKKFPEFAKKIETVYQDVVSGNLSVSMECLFKDFDYAILDADGKQSIIKRTERSSFLTKYLKYFGGKGEYEGHRIGILMRGIQFIGKGITDDPANPSSVIFDKESFMFANAQCINPEDIFKSIEKKFGVYKFCKRRTKNDFR